MIDVSFACTTIAKRIWQYIKFVSFGIMWKTILDYFIFICIPLSLQSIIYVFRTWSCWLLFHVTQRMFWGFYPSLKFVTWIVTWLAIRHMTTLTTLVPDIFSISISFGYSISKYSAYVHEAIVNTWKFNWQTKWKQQTCIYSNFGSSWLRLF